MRDDAFAEVVGAHLLASEPSAALWHRVAHGELSAGEAAAQLLAERPDVSAQEHEAMERAQRVFAPPSPAQRRARLAALLEQRAKEVVASGPSIADDGTKAASQGDAAVVSLSSYRSRRWAVVLLAAAAAVVLLVWLASPRPRVSGDVAFVAQYRIELGKAAADERGPEPATTFQTDWKLVIRLRPEITVHEAVGAVMYVKDAGGEARRLEVEPTVHPKGVMVLETTIQGLGLEEGEHELVVAVGRKDALPPSWEALVEAEQAGPVGFEVVRQPIRVRPPSP